MKELLDIVDEKNNLTGKIAEKSYIHDNGIWHREVACWIMNEKGEILVQKRSLNKQHAPGKWDITAGHVKMGEELKKAMIREIQEEVGMKVIEDNLELLMIAKREGITTNNNTFQYQYFTYTYKKIEEYKMQKEEVDEIKYISLKDLREIILKRDEEYTFAKREYIKDIIKIINGKIPKQSRYNSKRVI